MLTIIILYIIFSYGLSPISSEMVFKNWIQININLKSKTFTRTRGIPIIIIIIIIHITCSWLLSLLKKSKLLILRTHSRVSSMASQSAGLNKISSSF